jgi:DNA-directed RNA polymerase specialized sigma24 family protein
MKLASPSAAPTLADLAEAWHAPLFCFALCLVGRREAAAQLTLETFRRWTPVPAARRGGERRELFTGLYRLAAGPAGEMAPGAAAAPAGPPDSIPPEAESIARLRPEELVAAFQRVDAACRAPLALSYAGDFTALEIAEITGVTPAAALARLESAKAQLLAALPAPEADGTPRWAAAG